MSDTWIPEPTDDSRPFFDGATEGKLRLQCCADCETWTFPLRQRCQNCGSTALEWRDASGRGTVYSHALLHRQYHPRHEGRLPLVLAQIDLEEGVRMPSNIVGADPGSISVGAAVTVDFEAFPDGGAIPVFRLA